MVARDVGTVGQPVVASAAGGAPEGFGMTVEVPFCFVDVFASRPLEGNPLSLVVDADLLDKRQMGAISREFNQSETTFLMRATCAGATWRLRSFTPIGAEVFGAGHNALGAWLWLALTDRLPGEGSALAQEIGDEVLPVEVDRQPGRPVVVAMDQGRLERGAVVDDLAGLAASLGLAPADLVPDVPAQVASTGAGHLLVPLRDRAAVDRAAPDVALLAAALRQVGGEGCYLYSRDVVDPVGAVAYTRFFNPTVGIVEDPATGTAAGPLVATLVERGEVPGDCTHVVEQGHALGRPSRLRVTVSGDRIRLSGSGVVSASGTLHL